jgi:hypothetical protein
VTFVRSELVEASIVAIPANPRALATVKALGISAETRQLIFKQSEASSRPSVKRAHGLNELRAAELRFERARDALVAACDKLAELRRADKQIARAVEDAQHTPSGAAYQAAPPSGGGAARLRLLDSKALGRVLRHAKERVAIAEIDLAAAHDECSSLYRQTRR